MTRNSLCYTVSVATGPIVHPAVTIAASATLMTSEENDWQNDELEDLVDESEPTASGRSRSSFIWLQVFAFLLGIGLLVFVINQVGVQPIFDALLRIGFGFFFLLGISGLRHIFRTIAMRAAVPTEHRRISFMQAFAARLGGEAISFLTFTGPLLGEATKVALLRKRIPLTYGVPALVVDNLLYNLSVVFFILSGACVMLFTYQLPLSRLLRLDRNSGSCGAGHRCCGTGRQATDHAFDLGDRSTGPTSSQSKGPD